MTQRSVEYFSSDGLRTLTGLDKSRWERAVVKELLDNALDALDRPSAGGDHRKAHPYLHRWGAGSE